MCDKQETANTEITNDVLNKEGLFVLPNHYKVYDLSQQKNQARFLSGNYKSNDLESFVKYVGCNIAQGSTIRVFVDGKTMTAQTYLDLLLGDDSFGHQVHQAAITLVQDHKMAYLSDIGRDCGQSSFVDTLSMIPPEMITFMDSSKATLSYESSIGTLSDITIENIKSNRTKVTDTSYEENGSLSTAIKSNNTIPVYVGFEFNIFDCLNNGIMYFKIKYITNRDKPTMRLEPINLDTIMQDCAKDFCHVVKDKFDGKAEVYIGQFKS
jgi:uncharacterized protein YfdQ (DUF2303 family)